MSIEEMGCCGAYCKTCSAFTGKVCRGCKTGYNSGERDINKARCKMKVCCIKGKMNSCADCEKYPVCAVIQQFHNKNGYKYGRYKQTIEFIRNSGYSLFLKIADKWKNAYGKFT